ncbi:hypothetical protein KQX54_008477 [Cotesia glomerata]|uniref:Uncharacterized protein n=1 Tax=Cotesia glomerata TaxID=32391 RepID=A0AAV7I4U3_COTGL|nr:hypothetical protein KQX54_008477 [Cotesia glomerata]
MEVATQGLESGSWITVKVFTCSAHRESAAVIEIGSPLTSEGTEKTRSRKVHGSRSERDGYQINYWATTHWIELHPMKLLGFSTGGLQYVAPVLTASLYR